jgi:hypothetical protein
MSAFDEGMTALRGGDAAGAIPHFQTAVQQGPSDGNAWGGLGLALCQVNRIDEGVRALDQAVSLLPENATLRFHLGRGLEALGRKADAAAAYQRAVELDPRQTQAAAGLARCGGSASAAHAGAPPMPGPPGHGQQPDYGAPGGYAGPPGYGGPPSSFGPPPSGPSASSTPPWEQPVAASRPLGATHQREFSRSSGGGFPWGWLMLIPLLGIIAAGVVFWAPISSTIANVPGLGFLGGPAVNDEGLRFSARFPPGYPKPTDATTSGPGARMLGGLDRLGAKMAAYTAKKGDVECNVFSLELPAQFAAQMTPDVMMTAQKRFSPGGAKLTEVTHQGNKGFEVQLTQGKQHLRTRTIIASPRMFMIGAASSKPDAINSPEVTAFMNSLDIRK